MENIGNLPSLDNDSFDWRRFIKQTVLRALCGVSEIILVSELASHITHCKVVTNVGF